MNKESIEVPVWWARGDGVSYKRDCLSPDHPENTYNYIKNTLGLIPEDYGVLHPYTEKYKDYTHEQLMSRIIQLERYINGD